MKLLWEVPIPPELNRERAVTINNQRVAARLGPMDVPREVVVQRQNRQVTMEFHYSSPPGEEAPTVESGDIRVTIGLHCRRVLALKCGDVVDINEAGQVIGVALALSRLLVGG